MRISNTIIHSAILVCATMVPPDQELASFAVQYLQNKALSVNPALVATNMEKYNKGAKLYAAYRNNIGRVEKKGFVQELYRYIWIYQLVASMYKTLTPQQLWKILDDKFQEEKINDEDLDRDRFGAFKLIDREFCTKDAIRENGKILVKFSEDFDNALEQLTRIFAGLEGFEYMSEIFTRKAIDEIMAAEGNKQSLEQSATQLAQPKVAAERVKSERKPDYTAKPGTSSSAKTELQLQDEIRILKKDKHDLEVKLSFAKKDAIRDFICTLTDYGWNCPLSELYRLLGDEETPEKIKGVINNLFMALGSENIKLTRERIGEEITLTEAHLRTYEPYKYEQLNLGDTAEIFYPGYRYAHEIMVRPVVRKTKKVEDESNENG